MLETLSSSDGTDEEELLTCETHDSHGCGDKTSRKWVALGHVDVDGRLLELSAAALATADAAVDAAAAAISVGLAIA